MMPRPLWDSYCHAYEQDPVFPIDPLETARTQLIAGHQEELYNLRYDNGQLVLINNQEMVVAEGPEALVRFDNIHQADYGYSCLQLEHLHYIAQE